MMRNKFILAAIAFFLAVLLTVSFFFALRSVSGFLSGKVKVRVGDDTFSVEIADNESERNVGLSGRGSLPSGRGMLFVYNWPLIPSFWMKDMNFPIDIVWISGGRVSGWVTDVDPQKGASITQLVRYSPSQPVDMVLELPSGTVVKNNIKVGDEVDVL